MNLTRKLLRSLLFASSLWLFEISQATAQLNVTFPVSRMVIQRNNANQAVAQIAGSYSVEIDAVEARAVARAQGQGTTTNWTTIQTSPSNGQFNGTLTISGGWYTLEVRGKRNGQVVASSSVDRFGVGEVFAIVGHSNAQGSACFIPSDGYTVDHCPTTSGAVDDRVTVVSLDQTTAEFQQYENTADTRYLPGLIFSQLSTWSGISPFARMSWFWGRMGDNLVQRIQVPVLFYNAGFGGSNMEQTYKAAYDIPFDHGFIKYSIRMPYVNVRNLMNLYVPTTGIRAILLQHGENDRGNPTDLIVSHHYGVIDKVRQEFNKPNLSWIIALSSYAGGRFDNVRQAQQQVINRSNYLTLQGPDLDNISSLEDRPDGIHYSPSGQEKVGLLWAQSITNDYLQTTQPYMAETQPLASIACAAGNQLTLTQPAGYQYIWNNAASSQSLTVGEGIYSARLINGQNKVLFSPPVAVPSSVRPANPTITTSGSVSLCQPGSVTLTSSYAGSNLWSTAESTRSIVAPTNGVFSVTAVNAVYGCRSNATSFTVSLSPTDLALSLGVSRRTVAVGDTATFFITITNEGGCDAGAVTFQNRLPNNMAFVSSADLIAANGIVTGTLANIPVGQSVIRRYVARITAPGTYQNAAQLTAQTRLDPDSQPNSGTADGQDDAATADLRTTATGSTLYVSANPNQTPLPAVQGNQPTPTSGKADLSLTLEASQRYVTVGQTVKITIKVNNLGALTATNIKIRNDLPTGLQPVTPLPAGMTLNGSVLMASINQLATGQTTSLTFTATVATTQNTFTNAAQVWSVDQADPDSTPGNGITNGEDDTAQIDFRTDSSTTGARIGTETPSSAPALPKVNGTVQHRFSREGGQ